MQEILFGYKLDPITWAYISALMMIGIYFKFYRFCSVRNLDLAALISFSPAFLMMYHGLLHDKPELVPAGYVWLFAVSAFFLVRLLLDPVMVRRPLLEPNLSAGGLAFTGISLLIFLMANVITNPPERLEKLLSQQEVQGVSNPGYAPFYQFSDFSNEVSSSDEQSRPHVHGNALRVAATRTAIILAHLLVVSGMVWIGFRHFDNIHTGIAAATLYLLAFYTSQFTRQMDHIVPAVFLVWAVAAYRRPMIAGVLIGLAAGMIYYPLFLIPLWCGFYWRRGLARFLLGVVTVLSLLIVAMALSAPDMGVFTIQLRQMFGLWNPFHAKFFGFWQYYDPAYRIPVLAAFVALCGSLTIWPAQKNLGTLLSCSAAVMLATQFWHAHLGGLCMAWYLPLLILTIFRPNLEDRVALSAVQPAWARRRQRD